jgi:hypothetical protein
MCRKRRFWVKEIDNLVLHGWHGAVLHGQRSVYCAKGMAHKSWKALDDLCGYERYTPKCIICICMYLYRVGYEPFLKMRKWTSPRL